MDVAELLDDAFARVHGVVRATVDGLSPDDLAWRPAPEANPIGWLVWHLTRVHDDHVADVAGVEQVYTAQGFAERLGAAYAPDATGYGMSSEEVGRLRIADPRLLLAYVEAVHEQTRDFLAGLGPADLDRVVDEGWDPAVTLGVRLVSVVGDTMQHAGQAAYVRGLLR